MEPAVPSHLHTAARRSPVVPKRTAIDDGVQQPLTTTLTSSGGTVGVSFVFKSLMS